MWGLNQVELRDRHVIKWIKQLKSGSLILDAGAGVQNQEILLTSEICFSRFWQV